MILMASSQGTVVPAEINEEAMKFFSIPDRVQAQLFLNAKLESMDGAVQEPDEKTRSSY